jgi:hypothetical protein
MSAVDPKQSFQGPLSEDQNDARLLHLFFASEPLQVQMRADRPKILNFETRYGWVPT